MKLKKEYIILVAIISALSLYLIMHNTKRIHYQLPEVPVVAPKDISKLEIVKAGETILLNKKENTWYVGPKEYPADSGKVKEMLEFVEQLTVTTLVSEAKSYDRYDLNDDKKIAVRVWTGDTLKLEFEIGKTATSYRHTFIKLAGDVRVYHAKGNFRDTFDQTTDTLRNMTVLAFSQVDIQQIQITKEKETIIVGRKQIPIEVSVTEDSGKSDKKAAEAPKTKMVWQTADGKEVDESSLDRLLASLAKIQCEKYINDKKKEDFISPVYEWKLQGTQEYTLAIFDKINKDAQNYPAISSENGYPFFLSDPQVDSLIKNTDEIWQHPSDAEQKKW